MRIRSVTAMLAVVFLAFSAHAADLGDLKLLPAEGDVVVQIDVKALLATPLVADLVKQAKMNPQVKANLEELRTDFKLDPEKDLTRLTMIVSAGEKPETLLVMDTTADYDTIIAAASKSQELKKASHGGVDYHVGGGAGMARIGKRLVMGDEVMLKRAIDAKKKGGLTRNKSMMALANPAARAGGQLWFAARVNETMKADPNLKDLETIRGSLDLAKGLKLRANVGTGAAATANQMVTGINTQLEQAKKDQAANPMAAAMGLGAVINGLKAKANGANVDITLDLTQAQVDQLKAMAQMMIGMAAMQQQQATPGMPPPGGKNAPAKGK